MNDFWSDVLTGATVIAIIVAGLEYPPMGLFFLSAIITGIATGWIKDEIKRRNKCKPPSKPTSRQ